MRQSRVLSFICIGSLLLNVFLILHLKLSFSSPSSSLSSLWDIHQHPREVTAPTSGSRSAPTSVKRRKSYRQPSVCVLTPLIGSDDGSLSLTTTTSSTITPWVSVPALAMSLSASQYPNLKLFLLSTSSSSEPSSPITGLMYFLRQLLSLHSSELIVQHLSVTPPASHHELPYSSTPFLLVDMAVDEYLNSHFSGCEFFVYARPPVQFSSHLFQAVSRPLGRVHEHLLTCHFISSGIWPQKLDYISRNGTTLEVFSKVGFGMIDLSALFIHRSVVDAPFSLRFIADRLKRPEDQLADVHWPIIEKQLLDKLSRWSSTLDILSLPRALVYVE